MACGRSINQKRDLDPDNLTDMVRSSEIKGIQSRKKTLGSLYRILLGQRRISIADVDGARKQLYLFVLFPSLPLSKENFNTKTSGLNFLSIEWFTQRHFLLYRLPIKARKLDGLISHEMPGKSTEKLRTWPTAPSNPRKFRSVYVTFFI